MGAARSGLSRWLEALSRRTESRAIAVLPPHVGAQIRRRVRARPTREGAWFLLLIVAVVLAALNTGNNLLYMVLGSLLGALVLNNVLAEWNLRGVRVARRLPDEAWAGRSASGTIQVHNVRRFGAAWSLLVREVDPDGNDLAIARALRVAPGAQIDVPARWTFPERGAVRLDVLVVESTFPFGLMRRWRELPMPASLLVFPHAHPGLARRRMSGSGRARSHQRQVGPSGDFRGLRPYMPGDPLRDLHWPTTARTGQPMVVERNREMSDAVMVEVKEHRGAEWERSLSRAAGQVVHHTGAGHAVGLRLGSLALPPRTGDPWRRHLLEQLARAPRRGDA
ncbi:MAG: DUF58 domain-containing protein [Myxococcota bacterium]|nr:DUF58 domain-containing protein [Myxococcota bacterium]